jgi:hypothetical protein
MVRRGKAQRVTAFLLATRQHFGEDDHRADESRMPLRVERVPFPDALPLPGGLPCSRTSVRLTSLWAR